VPSNLRIFGPAAILASILASSGLAQVANGSDETATSTTRVSTRRHGPAKIRGRRPDNTVESDNWSGFAATGSGFTDAKASWTVPAANCSVTPGTRSTPTYSSFWVGIDGYSSSTVEQIGTDSDCDGTTPTYYAWYEFYPADSFEISSVAIKPGDQISAEVSYSGSKFTVTITDETTKKSFSKTGTVNGAKRSSVEWIAEAPCCTRSGGILPLADFGTVDFGLDYTGVTGTNDATSGSVKGPISAFGSAVEQIVMATSAGVDEAVPSALSTDGTSFTIAWKSEGTTASSPPTGHH
jgi:hypothetical protein